MSYLEEAHMRSHDYSIEEAAGLMQLSEDTVRRWVSKKMIGSYQLGRGWRISEDEIQNILTARHEMEQERQFAPSAA